MVGLGLVLVMAFGFVALACGVIHHRLREHFELLWLAAAFLCGAVEILVLSVTRGSTTEFVVATVLTPAAYLCVTQTTRIIAAQRHQRWWLIAGVIGLALSSLILTVMGQPFLYNIMPFQLACALALGDCIARIWPKGRWRATDIGLIAALGGLALIFLTRVALFPTLFDVEASYTAIKLSDVNKAMMVASALLAILTAALLVARIVGGVIATYRMRAERDYLTGLLNRHAFDRAMDEQAGARGTVVVCDIDHFKQVNDRYGHPIGDDVLCTFASLLACMGHSAGRMGGEEFALLLPGRGMAEGLVLAEMIRSQFHRLAHPALANGHRLSASFGVAEYHATVSPHHALRNADAALYQAKRAGRNQVIPHGAPMAVPKAPTGKAGVRRAA